MDELESDHQRAFVEYLKTVPAPGRLGRTLWSYSYAVPNGQMLAGSKDQRARYMAFLKAQGLKPGVSDICIALPVGRYHGAYIELKRNPKSAVTPEQREWLALTSEVGYYSALAPGFDSAVEHTKVFLRG